MQQTYETFNDLAKLHNGETDLCKITKQYQVSQDPILFSFVFCELFPLSVLHSSKYFNLTGEDKASICVEELNKSMMAYDETKGAQIQTLYVRYVETRFRWETQVLHHQVRKGNYNTESLDIVPGEYGTSLNPILKGENDETYRLIDMYETLKSFNLTPNELSYCKLVTKYTTIKDTDIALILGISSAAITYIRRSLSKKLSIAICT